MRYLCVSDRVGCGSPMPLSRLVLPRLLSPLLPRWEPVTPALPPEPPPRTRREILARYRHLRQISKEQHQAVLDVISPSIVLNWAKRLGLAQGRTLLLESELELLLAEDLAIYLSGPGRSHPLDRYARAARLAPGSDRAILLEAMRQARFSLWRVERWHETTGLILRDLLRGGEAGCSTRHWRRPHHRGWSSPRVSCSPKPLP
jgi:hypothetical protein